VKAARWVWSRGKDGDNFKILPIAIKCALKNFYHKVGEPIVTEKTVQK